MKSLKNSFNVHPYEKANGKEFDQLLCALEERYEFASLYDDCNPFLAADVRWQKQD
jgi:hypothetical protein